MSSVGVRPPRRINRVEGVVAFIGWSQAPAVLSHNFPHWQLKKARRPAVYCNFPSYRQIIRGGTWFISLWKDGVPSSQSGRPCTSKGAQVVWSTTESGRRVEQHRGTTVITAHFMASPLPLDTNSIRWMVIHLRKIIWSDSERSWPLNLLGTTCPH